MTGTQTDSVARAADDLAAASRILAARQVVDGYGHVSVRHPDQPDQFLISRSMAPALVTPDDIMALDLEGQAVGGDERPVFLERFIHAAIYRARPDVNAVVHSHSPAVIPFGVVPTAPLHPVCHMACFIEDSAPVFEIRDTAGPGSDMLIRSMALGEALADSLGPHAVVLMRGHGSVVVAGTLPSAVYRAVYLEVNARVQSQAMQLGPVTFLTPKEARAAAAVNEGQVGRAWQLWRHEIDQAAGKGHKA